MFNLEFISKVSLYHSVIWLISTAGLWSVGEGYALSCAAAGALMAINLWALRILVGKITNGPASGFYAAMLGLKFVLLLTALALMLHVFELEVLGVVAGLASPLLAIVLATGHVMLTTDNAGSNLTPESTLMSSPES